MKDYHQRFAAVIDYIEANLDQHIDVVRLCDVAHLSKFHFHRQCSAHFGMPVMALVRLLKLKRAAYQLAYRSDKKVVDIAFDNGFDSHEAFSRAFKKHFLVSPSAFRQSPDWRPWQTTYQPILELRMKMMSESTHFDVHTVAFAEMQLATLEHKGAPATLGRTIMKFIQWRKQHGLPPNKSRTFNLVYDDPNTTPPAEYRFDVGCEVTTQPDVGDADIVFKSIPAGHCAVIRHIGNDDTLGVMVNYLYSQWLPSSGYELRDFPLFFERVSFFPEVPEHDMITDVYLPIQ